MLKTVFVVALIVAAVIGVPTAVLLSVFPLTTAELTVGAMKGGELPVQLILVWILLVPLGAALAYAVIRQRRRPAEYSTETADSRLIVDDVNELFDEGREVSRTLN
jgi:hypothetical protein